MPCHVTRTFDAKTGEAGTMVSCTRSRGKGPVLGPCVGCGGPALLLCDGRDPGATKTCDAPLCKRCTKKATVRAGVAGLDGIYTDTDADFCPRHAHQAVPRIVPAQSSLLLGSTPAKPPPPPAGTTTKRPRRLYRALTLTQPWAWTMTPPAGPKQIENRDWRPTPDLFPNRDWFLLHAGKKYDPKAAEWIQKRHGPVPSEEDLIARGEFGAFVAFARVLRLVYTLDEVFPEIDQAKWLEYGLEKNGKDNIGWWLEVHPLARPVPMLGSRKLWWSPPGLQDQLDAERERLRLDDLPVAV